VLKKASINQLPKLSVDLPDWLKSVVSPANFRKEATTLYERMEKARKDPSTLMTANFAVARTSWVWSDINTSKNFKRDAGVIPWCGCLEVYATKFYREKLLATSKAGAWLRQELDDLLSKHAKLGSHLMKLDDGELGSVMVNEWSFPDGIKTPHVGTTSPLAQNTVAHVLTKKAVSSVVEEAKESLQKMIERLESMSTAKVDPSKNSPIHDGVAEQITSLVDVSPSAPIDE
jgi:hypothetical protein